MIALGILTTWLTLTAAGFFGLSALRRAGACEDTAAGQMSADRLAPMFAARVSIPQALLQ